ncbi:MAG: hypothetical protein GQ569_07975, partial [Methylococcaceae bacterium]|nr:hypothetical protein [Methylococcaceae bacterium]
TVNAQCKAFTSPLNLDDAFSVAIDWATDRVFIADTARHQVYLFSSQGEELDSAKGFWFPNQLEVNNNKLYVADTNHHRLIALDISTDKLVKTDEEFDTRTENSRKLTEVWPSSFLLRPQQRWVINSKHDMSHGGIYIFDNDGIYSKKLHLPENADPFALLQIGQQVLITDFSLDRIYRYSLNGEYLGDFDSAILQKIQQGLTERRAHYAKLDSVFSILFAIALAGGFLLALYQQYQAQNELLAGQVSSQTAIDEPVLHWITPTNRFKALSYSMVLFVIALFCTLIVLLALHDFSLAEFFGNTWQIQLLVLILLLTSLLQLRYKIGITKNTLILHSPIKAKIVCPLNDIVFNEAFIIIGESTLRLDLLYKLFSASDIENHLYPVIKEAKQIDHIKRQTTFVTTLSAYIIQITIVCILTALFFYYGVLN